MATLKIRYADHLTRWYTDVKSIQIMNRWKVLDPRDPCWDGTENDEGTNSIRSNGRGYHTFHGCEYDYFQPGNTEAILVAVRNGSTADPDWTHGERYVVIPVGEAFLMNDEGKTIDRIG